MRGATIDHRDKIAVPSKHITKLVRNTLEARFDLHELLGPAECAELLLTIVKFHEVLTFHMLKFLPHFSPARWNARSYD